MSSLGNKTYILLVLATLVVIAAWLWLDPGQTNGNQTTRSLEDLEDQIRQQAQNEKNSAQTRTLSQSLKGSTHLRSDEETREQSRLHKEKMQLVDGMYMELSPLLLDEMLQEESPDMQWTREVEIYFARLLRDKQWSGTRSTEVNCRATLCKAQFSHTDRTAFETFRNNATHSGPLSGPKQGHPQFLDNGTVSLSIYFTKGWDETPFDRLLDRMVERVQSESGAKAAVPQ